MSAFSTASRSLVLRLLAKQAYLRPTAEEALLSCKSILAERQNEEGQGGGAGADAEHEAVLVGRCLSCLARQARPDSGLAHEFDDALHLVASPPPSTGSAESPMSAASWASSLVEEASP